MILHTEIFFNILHFIFPSSKILTNRLFNGYILCSYFVFVLNTCYQSPGKNNPTLAPSIPSSRLPPYTALSTPVLYSALRHPATVSFFF